MVHHSVLKKLLITTPIASVSALMMLGKKALAHDVNDEALAVPAFLPKLNISEQANNLISGLSEITNTIMNVTDWIKDLPTHIAHFSIFLLTEIFKILMLVLQTPLFLFNNSYIKDVSLVLSGVSILIVTALTMFEGIKRMLRMKHIKMVDIGKRYLIAILGAGIAPFLFEKAFQLINILVDAITKIGAYEITPHNVRNNLDPTAFDWMQTVLLLGFDITLVMMIIPILLQNGRRFFDLMCLSALTPLALTAWIFDNYRNLFRTWWENVKLLSLTPLVYSVFIVLLGLFIFGTRNVIDGNGLLIKFIIILGGISRLSNPPRFVKSKVDTGGNVIDSIKNTKKSFSKSKKEITDAWNYLTFKSLRKKTSKNGNKSVSK